jgi:replicative DNA helicase
MTVKPTIGQNSGDVVFEPTVVEALALKTINERRQPGVEGVHFGVPSVDRYFKPAYPGDLWVVLARPSHGKSQLLQWHARQEAERLLRIGKSNEIVLFLTLEMAVEDLALYDLAAQTSISVADIDEGKIDTAAWERLVQAARVRGALPLWLIGHSSDKARRRPVLSLAELYAALKWIESKIEVKFRCVYLDYLQRLHSGSEDERHIVVRTQANTLKDMALAFRTVVIVAAQSARAVDGRPNKQPKMGDCGESSGIEQTADRITSRWFLRITEPLDSWVADPGIRANGNMLLLGIAKQRRGPAGMCCPLYMDPEHNVIGDWDPTELRKLKS